MCGLFGAVGHSIDPTAIRTLLLLNELRGRDSVGFFTPDGKIYKEAKSASVWIRDEANRKLIKQLCTDHWAVCGHTRATTAGSVCDANAHPFRYGSIVGAHNGSVWAPKDYAVDSMYLMDLLSKQGPGQYQEALKDIGGWYMLTYLDERDKKIYFLNWTGTLHVNFVDGVMYYSSLPDHLFTATGAGSQISIRSGDVYAIDKERMLFEKLPDFKGGTFRGSNYAGTSGGVHAAGGHATSRKTAPAANNTTRFDRSVSGKVMVCGSGKDALWFGHQRNELWRPLRCQKWLNKRWPQAIAGVVYSLSPQELLKAEGGKPEAEKSKGEVEVHYQGKTFTVAEVRELMMEAGKDQHDIEDYIAKNSYDPKETIVID